MKKKSILFSASLFATALLLGADSGKAADAQMSPYMSQQSAAPLQQQSLAYNDVQEGSWSVPAGQSVESILQQWGTRSKWNIVWDCDYTYVTKSPATFQGSFRDAVTQLFGSLHDVEPRVYPRLYMKNRVLVVTNTVDK